MKIITGICMIALVTVLSVTPCLLAQAADADLSPLVDKAVDAFSDAAKGQATVKVVDSADIFSRIDLDSGNIEVSRTLLNSVYKSSGSPGIAFLLGHEVGHLNVKSGITGAAAEFEADRIGFELARKVSPQVSGETVKQVFSTFDAVGTDGLTGNMLNKIRQSVDMAHPTDQARLDYLAKTHAYSADLKFDSVAGRAGYQAIPDFEPGAKVVSPAKTKALASIKNDFVKGGLFVDVAVSAGMSVAGAMSSGQTFGEGVKSAVSYLGTSEFIVGDLFGGAVGAAVGSMIPLPASFVATGILGQALSSFPAIAGAMFGAQLGITAIQLIKDGEFSIAKLFSSISFTGTAFRAVGASVGMAVGSLIPIPFVGPIIGGICGSLLADKILKLFSGPSAESAERANASTTLSPDGTQTIESDTDNSDSAVSSLTSAEKAQNLKQQMDGYYGLFVQENQKGNLNLAMEYLNKYRVTKKQLTELEFVSER